MQTESTEELVEKLKAGDLSAFDRLFALYQGKAMRTAALICGDMALAEDITQEAFVKCYLTIQSLQNPQRFQPWFFKILTRMAWASADKNRRLVPAEAIFETVDSKNPPIYDRYPSDGNDQYEVLYQAIAGLSTKQRTTIILFYFNDFSIQEIAEVTSSLEAAVKSRLYVARRKLKKNLVKESITEGGLAYEERRV